MRCPICKQAVPDTARELRPFCSKRCKLIDLGKWLDGAYAIPDESDSPSEEELLENEPGAIVPRRR